jgi:hypothetical protein
MSILQKFRTPLRAAPWRKRRDIPSKRAMRLDTDPRTNGRSILDGKRDYRAAN